MSAPQSTPSSTKSVSSSASSIATGSVSTAGSATSTATDFVHTSCTSTAKTDDSISLVDRIAGAIAAAAIKYKEMDDAAYKNGVYFDGDVEVELPVGDTVEDLPLEVPILEHALGIAKRSACIGKIRINAFETAGRVQVFVNHVASGTTHGEVVGIVFNEIFNATGPFQIPDDFVNMVTDSMFRGGNSIIIAPDTVVRASWDANGQPTGDSYDGVLFIAEVENQHRSLPELIRHMGMLLSNFQNLNAVVGIKGECDTDGNKMHAFILIEWHIGPDGRALHVTKLFDFGPNEYLALKKTNAINTLQLPLPPAATRPIAAVHGAGVNLVHIPEWTRIVSGWDEPQITAHVVEIPASLLVAGAHSRGNGRPVTIPPEAVPARLDLVRLSRIFCRPPREGTI